MKEKKYEVGYQNKMNMMSLTGFNEKEIDLFFALIYKSDNGKKDVINMTFSEVCEIADIEKRSAVVLKKILGLNLKLKRLASLIEIEPNVFVTFSLFGDIITDGNNKTVEVPINPRFKSLLELGGTYTKYDLKNLTSLKGTYAKILFRLLKQWDNSSKELKINIADFRKIMGIPESYKMFNIDQTVLKPAMEQLKEFFPKLKLQKIKKGVKVDSLVFTWTEKKVIEKKPENVGFVERKQGLTAEDYYRFEAEKKEEIVAEKEEITKNKDLELSPELEEKALELLDPVYRANLKQTKNKSPKIYWSGLRQLLKEEK